MMKKKLSAFLTALACMASTAGVSASAISNTSDALAQEDFEGIIDNRMGGIKYHTNELSSVLLIETDGTPLNDEALQKLENYNGIYAPETELEIKENYPDLTLEPGSTLYELRFSRKFENPVAFARKFHLENEHVIAVHFVRRLSFQNCTLGKGLKFTLIDKSYELDPADFPELQNLSIDTAVINGVTVEGNGNWNGEFTDEVMAECHENNAEGSYEAYLFMKEIADRIMEEHSDVFSSVEPRLKSLDFAVGESLKTQSIWQSAGDCNADGEVNAQDAAEQLIAAANAATGGEIEITGANDVNADGAVNALDAAAVLAYAAAQGSGQNLSWVEILG